MLIQNLQYKQRSDSICSKKRLGVGQRVCLSVYAQPPLEVCWNSFITALPRAINAVAKVFHHYTVASFLTDSLIIYTLWLPVHFPSLWHSNIGMYRNLPSIIPSFAVELWWSIAWSTVSQVFSWVDMVIPCVLRMGAMSV